VKTRNPTVAEKADRTAFVYFAECLPKLYINCISPIWQHNKYIQNTEQYKRYKLYTKSPNASHGN